MTEKENLLQKTFHAGSANEIDKLVNDFRDENNIKFTQSHITYIETSDGRICLYDYVVFYLPKSGLKKEEAQEETKPCPKCGEEIKKYFVYHRKCGWSESR